jgi:dienelactone hydrolase
MLVHDDDLGRSQPGIVFVPDIRGVGLRPRAHVDLLVAQGYVVLVADMYGEGVNMRDREHGQELMNTVRSSQQGWRKRVRAAFDALAGQPQVDRTRIGAVGYCFGGGSVLQLALSGADMAAVVVMHGTLDGVALDDAANIKAKLLFCSGMDDPLMPRDRVIEMQDALRRGDVKDWEMITFGNTRHAFTNVDAPNNEMLAYNKIADERSQAAMMGIFKETFE